MKEQGRKKIRKGNEKKREERRTVEEQGWREK